MLKYAIKFFAPLGFALFCANLVHAGQVSVINPSSVGGTIGTVIPVIVVPPTVQPSVVEPSIVSPTVTSNTTTAINAPDPTVTSTNLAQPEALILENNSNSTMTFEASVSKSGPETLSQMGRENKTAFLVTPTSATTRTGTQPSKAISTPNTTLASFSADQISLAINFIETSLSDPNLTQSARTALLVELSRLNAAK